MCKSGKGAQATVAELGLLQVSDEGAIAAACDEVMDVGIGQGRRVRRGREKLFGFFVGEVMKKIGGKANPKVVNEVLKRKLKGD